jgi:putative membrane protein
MKKVIFFLCLTAIVACKKDDDNNDNGNGNGSGNSTTISDQDKSFAQMAAMANYAEIQAGQMAATSGSDSSIRAFGSMMVTDHQAALDELHVIADSLNVYAPDSLDSAHVALSLELALHTGHTFDSIYIHSQVNDHAAALNLFQTESTNGSHSLLKNYATSKISVIQMHKQMADSLAALY